VPDGPPPHHDLCFGCGQANLFGLQLEAQRGPGGAVEGRFFVKQDHQGPPGFAHAGVLAAALEEAMALAAAPAAGRTVRLELELLEAAPVGTFVSVSARVEATAERELRLSAVASDDAGQVLARATASHARVD
jgi:acyl-coenzyme A thioesterase PaaI-like protein